MPLARRYPGDGRRSGQRADGYVRRGELDRSARRPTKEAWTLH